MLQRKYLRSGEPVPSYDYLDYVSGLGYRNIYAGISCLSTGNVYFLTNQTINSDKDGRTTIGNNNTFTYDQTFTVPAVIGGDCIINFSFNMNSGPANTYFTATLYNVRNGVETSMGTITSSTYSAVMTARVCLKFNLTKTNFVIGDILRFKLLQFSTNSTLTVYVDPSSRQTLTETTSGATIPTSLIIKVPFVIET